MKNEKKEVKITDEMLATSGVHIINAPTGAGKSRAIKELKVPTLVVSPRCMLVDQQTENTFKENTNVVVRTVQSIAYMPHSEEYLEQFSVVVSDEAHDLIIAADYDDKCIEIVKKILHAPILICLTATDIGLEKLFRYLGRDAVTHKYTDDIHEKLRGGTFGYVPDMETVIDVIRRKLNKGEKVLFFSDKISRIKDVQRAFFYNKKILPVVAKSNDAYKTLCKERQKEIDEMIREQRFPEDVSVVCATRAMDVGLNLRNDSKFTTIITAVACQVTLRQCLGRKRLANDKGERIDFYCLPPTGQSLAQRRAIIEAELGKYDTYINHNDIYIKEYEGVKLDKKGIVYYTLRNGKEVTEIDFCKLVHYEYLMETVYKTPTQLAWKKLLEQMLGCQGIPIRPIKQQHDEQWQYEQTMELKKQMQGKVMGANEKEMLKYIYHNEVAGPKAFNRIWKERGWNEFYIDGDKEEKAIYITDPKTGQRKRKRGRNGWMFNETSEDNG